MIKNNGVIGVIVIFITIILQSTILSEVSVRGIKPDFVLIMIILFANYSGRMKGQILGFTMGLVQDFLSLAPLGFNALINTTIGYLSGATSGKIFLDPIVVPMVFVLIGTFLKSTLAYFLLSIFLIDKADTIFTSKLLIELSLNVVITPLLYLFFKIIKVFPSSLNARLS